MNSHNAHLYLPLVQALAEGKTLQVFRDEAWHDEPDRDFAFDGHPATYRVKPEADAATQQEGA